MKKIICVSIMFLAVTFAGASQQRQNTVPGEQLFIDNCGKCHPEGGNIINPLKNLQKATLDKNNLKTATAIVQYLLNPGPGMPRLIHSENGLSEAEAEEIARYILTGFAPRSTTTSRKSGRVLFEEYCSTCHANGGNSINPSKNLRAQTLASNKLKTEDDIVAYLLNPGPGMPRLIHRDYGLSEPDARRIIQYIMQTYK